MHCSCGGCKKLFSSLSAFDAHRTGRYSDNSRRCKSSEEMNTAGLFLSGATGRWSLKGKNPEYWQAKRKQIVTVTSLVSHGN